MTELFHLLTKRKSVIWLTVVFVVLFCWWIKIQQVISFEGEQYLYNWSYGIINIFGGLYGISLAYRKWGGFKSYLGRAIIFLSLGLISQWIGLQIWTYYNLIIKIEAPYPSIADVGYFLLIPFYTIAGIYIARVAGAQIQLRKIEGIFISIAISLTLFLFSFVLLERNVGIDSTNIPKTVLDIMYPLGEIIPFGIALYVFYLSRTVLGGKMKKKIVFLAFAFIVQFIAEYAFLFAMSKGWYVNGGFNDLLYPIAYLVMSYAIISFEDYR